MRLAFVYDRVNKIGGAERVLVTLHKIWPEAPLFTSVYNPQTASWSKKFKVIPSFLQRIPLAKNYHEWFLVLMPFIFESFNFSAFDVVISITSAEAKGVITGPSTLHICYCLTPTRYLWSGKKDYEKGFLGLGIRIFGSCLRHWDFAASKRPDVFWAISKTVQKRIRKYYRRESEVIYPPSPTSWRIRRTNPPVSKFQATSHKFQVNSQPCSHAAMQPFYLVVSRLVPYKRVDLAVKTFNRLGKKLVIIGVGTEKKRLERMARKNIKFVNQLTDEELAGYYESCRALIFPGEEDFGLTALEAQSFGKPVIGLAKGGLTETVIHGKTGWLFEKQTVKALIKAVEDFEEKRFSDRDCKIQARKFSEDKFIKKFKSEVEAEWRKHQKNI